MTTRIADFVFRAYEDYVLKEKNVEAGLKTLIEGTDSHSYLKSIDLLTKRGLDLTKEESDFIENYTAQSTTSEAEKIDIRLRLLKHDAAKSEEEKARILDEFNAKYVKCKLDHPAPASLRVKNADKKEVEEQEAKSILDEVDIEAELQQLYSRQRSFRDYNKALLARLDLSKLRKDDFYSLLKRLNTDLHLLSGTSKFCERYVEVLREDYGRVKSYKLDGDVMVNMPIEHMERLSSAMPELKEEGRFVGVYVRKKFCEEWLLCSSSEASCKEKRDSLIKIYEYIKGLPKQFPESKNRMLFAILQLGLFSAEYSEGYFTEYLEHFATKAHFAENSDSAVAQWDEGVKSVQTSRCYSNRELMVKYLEHFFSSGKTMADFSPFVPDHMLIGIWENTMLMTGGKVEFNDRNMRKLEALGRKVQISILDHNKELFAANDDIELHIETKNVLTLFIKVFTVNISNYYRKTMAPFRADMNLDGLVAMVERSVEYRQPSQVKVRDELKFPELKGKAGLYVVELIGNGKSSRAIIKIGSISLITQPTIAGQICYILDAERKVCCSPTTGIWLDSQFFKTDSKNGGRIVVPYIRSPKTSKAILLHDNLAQLVDFRRLNSAYSLECGFFLLPESVLMGNDATILIKPKLLVHERAADIAMLENVKCTVTTSTYTDHISATKTYENLKVSEREEVLVKFQVGANIERIYVNFTGVVVDRDSVPKELSSDHSFYLLTNSKECVIADLHLRLNAERDYELHVLGKNGEPIANTKVNLCFNASMLEYSIDTSGKTNDQGMIRLGRLKGVTSFTASMFVSTKQKKVKKAWKLPSQSLIQYRPNIDLIEGEAIELPISVEKMEGRLSLIKYYDGCVLSDLSSEIKVQHNGSDLYGTVSIRGLGHGEYRLKGLNKEGINVRVHKGAYWERNANYIMKKQSVLEAANKKSCIKIKSVEFEEGKEGKTQMKLKVEGVTKDEWRVHVMLFRYLPSVLDELTSQLAGEQQCRNAESFFQKWSNIYLSNRELSTEYRYCFDRRQQPRFTGNTLDKPRLLLKRTLVKSTHAEKEVVSEGTEYSRIEEPPVPTPFVPCRKPTGELEHSPDENYRAITLPLERTMIAMYQNFVGQAPLVRFNLPASEDGVVVLELDEKFQEVYGCALILAVEKDSAAHYLHPFPGTKAVKRNLSLTKALDRDKSYSEMRTAMCVSKYDKYVIEDITSANFQIIDSLEKVFQVLTELMAFRATGLSDLKDFKYLIKWDTLKEEEKNKMISRYGSHELHLFVYKKDPEYFERVVKRHLQNKMEKTFIDYYLLEDMNGMLKLTKSPAMREQMNSLERALFVEALVKSNSIPLAQAIAKRMRNSLFSKEKNVVEQNKIFDIVLSLGLTEDKDNQRNALSDMRSNIEMMNEQNKKLDEIMEITKSIKYGQMAIGSEISLRMNLLDAAETTNNIVASLRSQRSKDDDMFSVSKDELQSKEIPAPKAVLEELGETKEYAEANYYKTPFPKDWHNIISEADFWADYADHCLVPGNKPFLTHRFVSAHNGFAEAAAVLALLELPYASAEHGFRNMEGRSAELKAASNLVVFKKEIKECKEEEKANIIVAQKYIDWENSDDTESKIEEFLVNRPYKGQVIVTNISSRTLNFDVLVQVPQGSLPLMAFPYQKSYSHTLESYKAMKLEYVFYFPQPGEFAHFPANVAIGGVVVAKANCEVLSVVKERVKISEKNFGDVVSTGNCEMIVKFVRENPIEAIRGFSWDHLLWLLKDEKFYYPFIEVLKEQQRFVPAIWSYSFLHKKREDLLGEYLDSLKSLKKSCGYYFDSKLLKIRPADSGMQHLDYYPLVNPRAHKTVNTGTANQPLLLNVDLYNTYKMWILYLMEKPVWSLADKVNLVYYLLLQDRVSEALKVYAGIDVEKETEGMLRLQCDYISVYLDFYTGAPEFKKAREIVPKYTDYPITAWRLLFLSMKQQLEEYDGVPAKGTDQPEYEERKEMKQQKPIRTEPQLNVTLENKEIIIEYENVKLITVKYYLIDLEVMFSRSPFLSHDTEGFAYVKPNSASKVELDAASNLHKIPIPEKYRSKNLLIEINHRDIQKLVTYFSTTLKLQIFEKYGELKVLDEECRGLPQVYVKAFVAKEDGSVMFYKDGYTDVTGRFDYVSLNASQLSRVCKFSLFIMSDEHGSLIRECSPPSLTSKPDDDFGPRRMKLADFY